MENLTQLTTEEMNHIEGGSIIGFVLGFTGYLLERAADSIAAHPVRGGHHYEI
ncbi:MULTISPECIES: bacteriocin [Flavobacterium]|uniref:bacteriocin n=1 Tax=Flavobacterium TaxID=237 RepID=UPI00036753B3|nr:MULTISPECIES: bacteriocin [Flavobacterium]MDL2141069.1 bacteriocin [Flavobacterium tructae]